MLDVAMRVLDSKQATKETNGTLSSAMASLGGGSGAAANDAGKVDDLSASADVQSHPLVQTNGSVADVLALLAHSKNSTESGDTNHHSECEGGGGGGMVLAP
jgi:hypothetical protein